MREPIGFVYAIIGLLPEGLMLFGFDIEIEAALLAAIVFSQFNITRLQGPRCVRRFDNLFGWWR